MRKLLEVTLVGVVLLVMVLGLVKVAAISVDRITVRDCARGITEACQYVPNHGK